MGHFCSVPGGQEVGRTWWELLPLPTPKALVWFIEFLRKFSPLTLCSEPSSPPGNPSPPLQGLQEMRGCFPCSPPPAPIHATSPSQLAQRCSHLLQSARGAWLGVRNQTASLLLHPPRARGPMCTGGAQNLCTSASLSLRRSSSL